VSHETITGLCLLLTLGGGYLYFLNHRRRPGLARWGFLLSLAAAVVGAGMSLYYTPLF